MRFWWRGGEERNWGGWPARRGVCVWKKKGTITRGKLIEGDGKEILGGEKERINESGDWCCQKKCRPGDCDELGKGKSQGWPPRRGVIEGELEDTKLARQLKKRRE